MDLRISTERVATALASLRHNPTFGIVLEWLAEQTNAARIENDTELDPNVLRQRQGWIQALAALQTKVKESESIANRFRQSR